jgi:hypothetical protein
MQCNLCRNALSLMEEISCRERLRLKPIYNALYEEAMADMCAGLVEEYDFRTGTEAIRDKLHANMHKILLDNLGTILTLASEQMKRSKMSQAGKKRLASLVESVEWALARERG